MKKEDTKKAYQSAENELKEEEVKKVKEVIKATLEKLKEKQAERTKLDKEIKILKADIDDFKNGRLDKVAERQAVDEEAKDVSVFEITKKVVEEHHHYDRWYYPYTVVYPKPAYVYWGSTTATLSNTTMANVCAVDDFTFTTDCSTAKDVTSGTYELTNGSIKYL